MVTDTLKRIDRLEKTLNRIERNLKDIRQALDLDANAIIEVKGKDKHGDYILGKKKPMKIK